MGFVVFGCEESQTCCIEFRKAGHQAYSCDTQECSGGHPEWHFQMDIFKVIGGGYLTTQAGTSVYIPAWDMMIAFPPCTHLAVSGAKHFEKKRLDGRQKEGIDFFIKLTKTNIPKWCIENPVGIMSNLYRKPNQIIQPYYWGDNSKKTTCLWLNDLPLLLHTKRDTLFEKSNYVAPDIYTTKSGKNFSRDYMVALSAGPNRGKLRSKTYPGIAKQMAEQWSPLLPK